MSATPALPDEATWRRWGIEPAWSRQLDVRGQDGVTHRWHVLDTGPPAATAGDIEPITLVCVHGNPTWAYAWKALLTRCSPGHRVIAIDQLSMGYSERVAPRRYADRVADLEDIIDALEPDASRPLALAAHDWGGAIAMGWAVAHPTRVAGLVLCNTGIAVPDGREAPGIIRLAASRPLLDLVCRRTSAFVEGTVRMAGNRIDAIDREAFRAPYRHAEHRRAIAEFVADVPLASPHPSEQALADVASRLHTLEQPVLLAWGARDIVFNDDFAADLQARMPQARLQRYAAANHLVMAEADVAGAVESWLADRPHRASDESAAAVPMVEPAGASVFTGLERRRASREIAIADLAADDSIDFRTFAARVDGIAAALIERGLYPGDRVAMLTPPGIDLIAAVYGVWRAGGVTVIADRGLGLRGLGRAVRSARPAWSIGPRAARAVSAAMRWAPRATHLDVDELMQSATALADAVRLEDAPADARLAHEPMPDDEIAILFTSGATGPAKGVRYRHRQLAAQRDALATAYGITDDDRLVAAFAPFALYGPALGVSTALADADVTRPGKLTAHALDAACAAISATLVFASPAALANVVATAVDAPDATAFAAARLILSAGAPVPSEILHAVATLAPNASLHTPYGMTEALPVADLDLAGIDAAEAARTGAQETGGVCVGRPVAGCEVRIVPLTIDGALASVDPLGVGETGEILARAPWVSDGYVGRWHVERLARPGDGWHRTGDVGHLDRDGRLWVEGRAVHIIHGAHGPITSVPLERDVEHALIPHGLADAGRVAAVGIGPPGCSVLVIVIERAGQFRALQLADDAVARAVRDAVDGPVAAVLTTRRLPVDIRHNAKIDRTAVARRVSAFLAGDAVAPQVTP